MEKIKIETKIFLDSSVIIAALLSAKGGSFYILQRFKDFEFVFCTNEYVLTEVQRVLSDKFSERPELPSQLFLLLGISKVRVESNPSQSQVVAAAKLISQKDAPVLAGALIDSDSLLTLDKEFFKTEIKKFVKSKGMFIFSPKEFIEFYS